MIERPDTQSSDRAAMEEYYRLVDDIMGGAPSMRAGREKYLPRFEKETEKEYEQRVQTAPFTPIYEDAFRNLVSKPFSEEVKLGEDAHQDLKPLVEDIDTAGSHMHVFAREVFKGGVNYGADFILVDKVPLKDGKVTIAAERKAGARPYWVRIPAKRMIAYYEDRVDGRIQPVHARIDETVKKRVGFGEAEVKRVRTLNREPILDGDKIIGYEKATFTVEEQRKDAEGKITWVAVEKGPIAIGEIAIAPFVTGEREPGSWLIRPPLRSLAHMQVTEFQMESNLHRVQTMTAFPVNVLRGVARPEKEEDCNISLGPRTVLWFPPIGENGNSGDFRREEPSGEAATSLREDVATFRQQMREAGMQPLTPQSGTLTATATAVAEAKAHSAVEMWALALKDTLEQAWVFTCKWMAMPETQYPDVLVHTDFAVGQKSVEEMGVVKDLHEDALISGEQRIEEAVRRGILGQSYDREKDKARQLAEMPGDDMDDITSALPRASAA